MHPQFQYEHPQPDHELFELRESLNYTWPLGFLEPLFSHFTFRQFWIPDEHKLEAGCKELYIIHRAEGVRGWYLTFRGIRGVRCRGLDINRGGSLLVKGGITRGREG